MRQLDEEVAEKFMEMDTCRAEPHMDVLDDCAYLGLGLLDMAWTGRISVVLGGPMCRTWSILRWFKKKGFPEPVRGRSGEHCWGWNPIRQQPLSMEKQLEVDDDSLLILRLLLIFVVAKLQGHRIGFLMEHPADPASYSQQASHQQCASWWATVQFREASQGHSAPWVTLRRS